MQCIDRRLLGREEARDHEFGRDEVGLELELSDLDVGLPLLLGRAVVVSILFFPSTMIRLSPAAFTQPSEAIIWASSCIVPFQYSMKTW